MAKKSKGSLESGVRSLEEEGPVVDPGLVEVPAYERTFLDEQILAEQEERIRISAEAEKRYRYDQYFQACLSGALGYYGIIATDMERVQLLVHEAACQLMASEKARHASLAELNL